MSNRMTQPPGSCPSSADQTAFSTPSAASPPSQETRQPLSLGQILNRPLQLLLIHTSLSRRRVAPHRFIQAFTAPGLGNPGLNSRSRNPTDGSSRWSWTRMNLHGILSQAEPSNGSPIVKPAHWACHAPGPLALVTRFIASPNPASGTTLLPAYWTSYHMRRIDSRWSACFITS